MNRVVLCGRLVGPPTLSYTPCGVPLVSFQLRVPRLEPGSGPQLAPHPLETEEDLVLCLACRRLAVALYTWGERGCRVNLEGRLRAEPRPGRTDTATPGLHVHVDYAYCADPPVLGVALLLPVLREETAVSVRKQAA